jgi:hypothetical protein
MMATMMATHDGGGRARIGEALWVGEDAALTNAALVLMQLLLLLHAPHCSPRVTAVRCPGEAGCVRLRRACAGSDQEQLQR